MPTETILFFGIAALALCQCVANVLIGVLFFKVWRLEEKDYDPPVYGR